MPRAAIPAVSPAGQQLLTTYTVQLQEHQDLAGATQRNYLSDVRHFIAWCEAQWAAQPECHAAFDLRRITTATLTRYRAALQTEQKLRPATVNRTLTSLKRFFAWAVQQELLPRTPAQVVKWVPEALTAPHRLTDQQEDDLLAAVAGSGSLRDRTLITLMLHTGLRAGEVCALRREQIVLHPRSGTVQVRGKRNKAREVPLNATARAGLGEYLRSLPAEGVYLFPSARTGTPRTERALGHLIAKYARQAQLTGVSPHTLRHRFGYRMAQTVPLHRLAQIMGHDSLDTTLLYIKGSASDLQHEVEKIAWT